MEQNYLIRAAKYLADLRKRKAWKKVVSALGTAVVFCTVYALILPAITMTRPLTCTVEVHHHDESCYAAAEPSTIAAGVNLPRQICGVESVYADVAPGVDRADFVLHTHNDSCWQDGQLVCSLPERHVHQHTAACYQTVKELVCGHPEAGTDTVPPVNPDTQQPPVTVEPEPEPVPIHQHTELCYTNAIVCGLEETPAVAGHTHDENCYTTEIIPGELICTITAEADPEHIHDENCYGPEQTNQVLICGQEESLPVEGHTHTDACWRMELTCGMQEGQPELTNIPDEPIPTSENDFAPITITDEVPVTMGQDGLENNMDGQQTPSGVHVHTDACYVEREILSCPEVVDTPHEHDDTCRDVNGNFICGRIVTREHIHTAECFVVDAPDETLPEPERTPICGKQEHEHGVDCYAPVEEPTVDRAEQDQKWGALFWSDIVAGTTETISGQISANWMDTQNMDILALEALRNAQPEDLTRYLGRENGANTNNIGIWIGDHTYNANNDGPMDPDAPFTVRLAWELSAEQFAVETTTTAAPTPPETVTVPEEQQQYFTAQDMEGYTGDMALAPIAYAADQIVPETAPAAPATTTTVTARGTLSYYYRLPDGIVVENVEKRVLYNEGTENPALSYSVQDNVLNVTYYAPAESVNTTFTLKANWAEGITDNETFTLNWSNSTFSTVEFASPKLELTKSMGESGLRVEEDGTVWADYTVTVKNDSPVAAKDITLSDTLESEMFHFYRGGFAEGGADYTVTTLTPAANGEDGGELTPETTTTTNETFPVEFDGGNTLVFPVFELAPGETKTFTYMAQMSAEDRETIDAAILAEAESLPQGQRPSGVTVSNTAVVTCPGSKTTPELTAKAQATYGGPDSKHIDSMNESYTSKDGMFDVNFVITGDAILPPGITNEVLEARNGGYSFKVEELEETDETYLAFAQALEEEDGEDEDEDEAESALSVMHLELRYNGVRLDLADCDVTVTVTPTEALRNYRKSLAETYKAKEDGEEEEEVLGDEGFSVILRALTLEETTTNDALAGVTTTTEIVEQGIIALDINTRETAAAPAATTESAAPAMMYAARMAAPAADTADTAISATSDAVTYSMNGSDTTAIERSAPDYPMFNVVFFAQLERLDFLENGGNLTVIDTSNGGEGNGGNLPSTANPATKSLAVDSTGKIQTKAEDVQLFEAIPLPISPYHSLTLNRFNVLEQFYEDQKTYELVSAYILDKEGKQKEPAADYTFENITAESAKSIELTGKLDEGDTVKMVFKTVNGDHSNAAVFYDYDITDGKIYKTLTKKDESTYILSGPEETTKQAENPTTKYYVDTRDKGINSESNYNSGSQIRYGFGNANTDTTIGGKDVKTHADHYLNRANSAGFNSCTFGIAAPALVNGTLAFADGIDGPNIFNQANAGKVEGKTTYPSEYSLDFLREGDTYTLRSVVGAGNSASNLHLLDTQGYKYSGTNVTPRIFTNEFWPMDSATSYGTTGHDLKFGSYTNLNKRTSWKGQNLPTSDFPAVEDAKAWGGWRSDGDQDHNSYFGMQFSVKFKIPKGYIGPLDYCFFGDDDLWLYLEALDGSKFSNGQSSILICDIGGVHSSVGEYVDLWDYISKDATGDREYKLHLFYTERGASGSTCWMQYTLPGVQSVPVDVPAEPDLSNLRIEKKVEGVAAAEMKYNFKLNVDRVTTTSQGNITVNASCIYLDANGLPIKAEDLEGRPTEISANTDFTFWLREGESLLVSNLPKNTTYKLWELKDNNNYETTVSKTENGTTVEHPNYAENSEGKYVTGQTGNGTMLTVTYTNTFHYALPETGAAGTTGRIWYTYGALPVMAAAVVVYKRSRKKGGTVS